MARLAWLGTIGTLNETSDLVFFSEYCSLHYPCAMSSGVRLLAIISLVFGLVPMYCDSSFKLGFFGVSLGFGEVDVDKSCA